MSCLHEAASLGDADLLEEGLARGVDPNERDWDWGGRTALHIAAANGDKDCVLLLLQYDAKYARSQSVKLFLCKVIYTTIVIFTHGMGFSRYL